MGLTIQVGERNFVKLDVAAKSTVWSGETADTAHDRLFSLLELTVSQKIDEYADQFK